MQFLHDGKALILEKKQKMINRRIGPIHQDVYSKTI